MAKHTVRWGGFLWLKHVSVSVVSWRRRYVVECLGLKPCWSLAVGRNSLLEGKKSASRTLAAGHSSGWVCRKCLVMTPCLAWESGWLMRSSRLTEGGKTMESLWSVVRCSVARVLGSSSGRCWESQGRMLCYSCSSWLQWWSGRWWTIPLPLETSDLHPPTHDESSSMKSACPD